MPKSQLEIPGTERKTIKAIEDAAEVYRGFRGLPQWAHEKEIESLTALVAVCEKWQDNLPVIADGKDKGKRLYRYDDGGDESFDVIVGTKTVVRVRKHKDAAPEDNDEE